MLNLKEWINRGQYETDQAQSSLASECIEGLWSCSNLLSIYVAANCGSLRWAVLEWTQFSVAMVASGGFIQTSFIESIEFRVKNWKSGTKSLKSHFSPEWQRAASVRRVSWTRLWCPAGRSQTGSPWSGSEWTHQFLHPEYEIHSVNLQNIFKHKVVNESKTNYVLSVTLVCVFYFYSFYCVLLVRPIWDHTVCFFHKLKGD